MLNEDLATPIGENQRVGTNRAPVGSRTRRASGRADLSTVAGNRLADHVLARA